MWAWYFACLSNCVVKNHLMFSLHDSYGHIQMRQTLKGLTHRQFTLLSTLVTRITQDWTLLAETQIKVNLTVSPDSKIY